MKHIAVIVLSLYVTGIVGAFRNHIKHRQDRRTK